MVEKISFHIRNANPDDMRALLWVLNEQSGLSSIQEIVSIAEKKGFRINDRKRLESLATAKDLGLVDENEYRLTEIGDSLVRIDQNKPDLFSEIIHGLQYSLWSEEFPSKFGFSWSYRTICDMLWDFNIPGVTDTRQIASEVESRIRTSLGLSDVPFSIKSVGGAFLWINSLAPSVIDQIKKGFRRRLFCSPELIVMAVDYLYQKQKMEYQSSLLLTEEKKDSICRFCLLDVDGFERVLSYAVQQYAFFEKGIGGGWGRFLTLKHHPTLKELE